VLEAIEKRLVALEGRIAPLPADNKKFDPPVVSFTPPQSEEHTAESQSVVSSVVPLSAA
jgi:hypothetical protein